MRCLVALTFALCACEARIGATSDNGPDASGGDDGSPGGVDAAATADAPACFNGRVVFLQFEGQTLTAGASDAKTNHASWMQIQQGTAPAYHAGSATRTADIQAIVDGVTQQLSSFPIIVVTTRPTTGDYMMIVYGGTPQNVGSRFGGAVQQLDCGDLARNDVAWVADSVTPTQKIVNFTIGSIGFGLGLTATLTPTDCMCGWDNNCVSDNSAACTLTTPTIQRDPNARQRCPGVTTQDEVGAFKQGFCQ